tara:strand:+ start:774 stop:1643 length:870 start_codon:yes stop_codon:yes gene_type:complete
MEPVIFLLDLDGTLQGDVNPQLKEYDLLYKVNSKLKKRIRYNTKLLFKDMENGLIRPHVKNALHNIKSKHKNVEFFIYTASSDGWAKFLLPKIISFGSFENIINKPFFTRSHCLPDGRKSIANLKPLIMKSLKQNKKYENATFKHIFLVDNNFVLNIPEIDRLLYCPSYNYKALNCPLRSIDDDNLNKYHDLISNHLFNLNTTHKLHLLKIYYDRAFKEYVDTELMNKQYESDQYWYTFNEVMKKSRLTTDADVRKTISKLRMIHMTKEFAVLIKQYIEFVKKKFKSKS